LSVGDLEPVLHEASLPLEIVVPMSSQRYYTPTMADAEPVEVEPKRTSMGPHGSAAVAREPALCDAAHCPLLAKLSAL
jgi:hypothetical protein